MRSLSTTSLDKTWISLKILFTKEKKTCRITDPAVAQEIELSFLALKSNSDPAICLPLVVQHLVVRWGLQKIYYVHLPIVITAHVFPLFSQLQENSVTLASPRCWVTQTGTKKAILWLHLNPISLLSARHLQKSFTRLHTTNPKITSGRLLNPLEEKATLGSACDAHMWVSLS